MVIDGSGKGIRDREWSFKTGLAKFQSNFTGLAVSFFERFCTSHSLDVFFAKPFWSLNLGLTI